jgi:catechol 2,3-dioxygenase-like lactoylglutathione lyase family enzyme
MLKIAMLHHVSVPVSDISKARAFYGGVLGLQEDPGRPKFDFDGAWYKVGDRMIHLIVPEAADDPTYRSNKAIDSHDAHCAIRVESFAGAIAHLEAKGYRRTSDRNPAPSAANPLPMRVNAAGKAGFPQIYVLDPDRNLIEINAATED